MDVNGRRKKYTEKFIENLKGRDQLVDRDVKGNNIKADLKEIKSENRVQWRVLAKMLMNLRIS
jgi:hypothetical protein